MPRNSIDDLPTEIRKALPDGAQKLFLKSFNSARPQSFLAASKETDGKLTISGPLIRIDEINENGWGVPGTEVAGIIERLAGIPLKKCNGMESVIDGHSCDYDWNNRDDIGKIAAAFEKDGWIHATAEVTDRTAVRKIDDRTWANKWSVFVAHASETSKGMIGGVFPLSVTLVDKPAYPAAGFDVTVGAGATPKNAGDNMAEDPAENPETYTKEQAEQLVAAAIKKQANDYETKLKTMGAGHEKALDRLKAEHAEALKEASEKTRDPEMVPRSEVEKMVAAAVEQAKTVTMDTIKKEALVTEVADMQAAAGMIKPEDREALIESLGRKSAETLQADKDLLVKVQTALKTAGESAVDKFKETVLQGTGNTQPAGFTVGRIGADGKWGTE